MSVAPVVVVPVRDGILPSGAHDVAAEGLEAGAALIMVEVGEVSAGAWSVALAPELAAASFVLLPASPDGRDLAPRLAAELGWPLLANALSVRVDEVVVSHHGGRLQSTVVPGGPFVATLQPGVRGAVAHGEIIPLDGRTLEAPVDRSGVTLLGVDPPEAATMDLAEAPRIVGGGAGMMSGDDIAGRFDQLTAVGASIGASMGATRVVTDAGWVHHDRQIGTTGVVVDPDLYLAFGISGAVQHTAGLGNPDHVISVNTDSHCPMMAMADLAVVADANAVLDELAVRLGAMS